jgi:hypothetical protein
MAHHDLAGDGVAELLLQGAGHDTPHGVALPARSRGQLADCCAFWPLQKPNDGFLLAAGPGSATGRPRLVRWIAGP